VLVGVWAPRRSELSLAALQQYLTPKQPPISQWIDKKPSFDRQATTPTSLSSPSEPSTSSSTPPSPATPSPAPANANSASASTSKPSSKKSKKRRPPTRRLVRHVLRARAEAARALGALFAELEVAPDTKRIHASPHLAQLYGGFTNAVDAEAKDASGFRNASEILSFLRARGARIAALSSTIAGDYWAARAAAMSSEAELSDADSSLGSGAGDGDDLVWVPPSVSSS